MPRTAPAVAFKNPGDVISSALWNSGPKAMGDFYTAVPAFRIGQATFVTTTSANWSAMPFDVTDLDTDSGHSNVTNNTRYTGQVAGWYLIQGFVAWAAAGAQCNIWCALAVNGTLLNGSQQVLQKQGTGLAAVSSQALVQLHVGDYVETWGRQDSGGNVNTFDGVDLRPCMQGLWMHS